MSNGQGERIAIIGAGFAGLLAALMLAKSGRTILLLERDPAPAADAADPEAAFADRRRRGVGQLRHSHAFLARLVNAVRDAHPALLDAWTAAGCREVALADLVPSSLRGRYVARPGDERLSMLVGRRTTVEAILRRYVERLDGVRIRSDAFVAGLLFADGACAVPTVTGVALEDGERLEADLVVDAAGRLSRSADWLAGHGIALAEAGEPAGIVYYTRHWRLNPGQARPPRNASPGAGDLGYLKFGLFEADGGWFSVTLAVPETETGLRRILPDPEAFDTACRALPGVGPWIEPGRATPQTGVFGMGDLGSRWRGLVRDGRPQVLGLVLIGDALIRSNPLYGRGTAFAAVEAEALARTVAASADPATRIKLYESLVEQALRPFYDDMQAQDRRAIRTAAAVRAGEPAPLHHQLTRSFVQDGASLAVRDDPDAFRAALRSFHMLDPPQAWIREPRHIRLALRTWARGRRRNAHLYPGPMGPDRREMLALLGLDAADGEALAA